MKEIVDMLGFIKIKNFFSAKDNSKELEDKPKIGRKYLQKIELAKDSWPNILLMKIYKELLKLNNKKTTRLKNGPKTLTNTSPKKTCRWQINIWKDVPYHMPSGKCKLRQKWDTTTNLLNGPNLKHWQHQTLARIWSKRNTHLLLVGTQSHTATLEDSLAVSYKCKHTLTTQSSRHAPWYLPNGVENLCPPKKTYTWMFIAALFIIVKTWKQPRYPLVGEWINCGASRQWNIIQCWKEMSC